jgi:hypothetical protein
MSEGIAQGEDKAAPEVAESARAATAGAAQAAGDGGRGAATGQSATAAAGPTFQFYNCDFGQATEDSVRAMMHRAFEAESMGAALPRVA